MLPGIAGKRKTRYPLVQDPVLLVPTVSMPAVMCVYTYRLRYFLTSMLLSLAARKRQLNFHYRLAALAAGRHYIRTYISGSLPSITTWGYPSRSGCIADNTRTWRDEGDASGSLGGGGVVCAAPAPVVAAASGRGWSYRRRAYHGHSASLWVIHSDYAGVESPRVKATPQTIRPKELNISTQYIKIAYSLT